MHILLIHQAFAALSEPGGTRHHELARRLQRMGHRVTVITGQVSYLTGRATVASREVDDAGVEILRVRSTTGWHHSFFGRVIGFITFMITSFFAGLRVDSVDLIWGTTPPLFQTGSAWALARLKRTPFLLEVRDLWPYFAVAVGVLRNRLLVGWASWFERFIYGRADVIVANSPGFVAHITQRGEAHVEVIPNGVDVAAFDQPQPSPGFRELHGLQERFVVLYAGAHGLSNDLGTVLRAAQILQPEKAFCFVLLGDGKEKPGLIDEARERGLDNVLFLDPLPKERMPWALAGADAGLAILKPIPAYRTTYPNKVFDYMAAGLPVLLAIDGVMREVVEGAQAGIFVTPGDPEDLAAAVRRLAADPDAAHAMGEAGRACVRERFDRDASARELEALMRSLAEKGTP